MSKRLRRITVLLVTVTALVVGLGASPAHAATGDWTTNKMLCRASACVNNGDIVRLWQAILWADGNFGDVKEIDGDFGGRTHNATVAWQSDWWLDPDGEVGPLTWGRAQAGRLDLDPGGDVCSGGYYRYTYHGWGDGSTYPNYRNFKLRMRCSDRYWQFQNPLTGVW